MNTNKVKLTAVLMYLSIIITSVFMFSSCTKSSSSSNVTTYVADVQAFGADSVTSWVKKDANGNPLSVGITFKAKALTGLPTFDTMYMLMLPMSGSGMGMNMMVSPFDHVEIDWSANGDAAPSVYNKPHLDAHFFTVTMNDQMGIMGGMDSVMLDSKYIPKNCVADGDAEMGMGVHYIDTMSLEFRGYPFQHSYNYGFYGGKLTFIEAMSSKAYLDSKVNYTGSIAQPSNYKMGGYYPMGYAIKYDASTDSYTYSLENLMMH